MELELSTLRLLIDALWGNRWQGNVHQSPCTHRAGAWINIRFETEHTALIIEIRFVEDSNIAIHSFLGPEDEERRLEADTLEDL